MEIHQYALPGKAHKCYHRFKIRLFKLEDVEVILDMADDRFRGWNLISKKVSIFAQCKKEIFEIDFSKFWTLYNKEH